MSATELMHKWSIKHDELTRDSDFYDEYGDIEIVSSDNILFKVQQHELRTWSPVFKHMLADAIFPGSPRFVLVDVKLEAAGVIRTLLLFLRSRPHISQYNDTDSDRDTIVDLIHFARKYEIDVLLHIVTLQLSNVVETRLIVPEIIIWHFRLALALEDTALGALAVIQGRKFQSPSSPFDADGSFRPTLECRQEYLSIPGPMMWIFMELGRAAWGQDCEFDSETMQEHLVVRLEEADLRFTLDS